MKELTRFSGILRVGAILGALVLAAGLSPKVFADSPHGHGHGHGRGGEVEHVLLISIDGMHVLDFINCANGIASINGGAPYCPSLAALRNTGVNYLDTSAAKPSDSFPGLMAIVAGGSPRSVGAFYDVAYDRSLAPPTIATGNGLAGGTCTPGVFPGTTTEYEEGIDLDQSHLNGGAPSGDGQMNAIDPLKLPRDPANGCNPVFPQNFVRTNTVFGVVHKAGGYTSWFDKHVAYVTVSGPGDGSNIDDFYSPEINSDASNFDTEAPPVNILACHPLPDAAALGDDYTGSFQNAQCYDSLKVQGILNEIDGKKHNGVGSAPVPTLFGMNFQAVSIGEKLVYQHGAVAAGYSVTGGYLDSTGTPSPSLFQQIKFVDHSIGLMVAELQKNHLLDSTLIIITAKHGQSPIDPARVLRISGDLAGGMSPATIIDSLLPASEAPSGGQIGPTEDDISLLWLANSANTATAVALLQSTSTPLPLASNIAGIGEIFSGAAVGQMYNLPGLPPNGDPRTPDIIITPNIGVIYTGKKKKVAEHGGFAHDDINIMMLLSNPSLKAKTVTSPVETQQIAPTILKALGLDPHDLQSVQMEHTQALPDLDLD
ncbi:MAG TPA: alkaline phosphatase family protein [Candidatus Binataceae bacterium]|nr:alkaline phosphatase family protein [Candidatus Binataceae bacterium]